MQIVKRHQDETEIDLLGVLQLFWKKKIQLLFFGALFGGIFLAFAVFGITPKYTASITLYANNSNSKDKSSSITASDINASVQLVDTYAAIILTDSVLDQVIHELRLPYSYEELAQSVKIGAVNGTEVFKVSVIDTSPQMAAKIANKISEVAPKQIEEIVDGCSVKLVNAAKTPTKKSSPSYKKFLIIGVFLGVFADAFLLLLTAMLDTRIKSEEDLAGFGLPMLSMIPDFAESKKMKAYGYGYKKEGKR